MLNLFQHLTGLDVKLPAYKTLKPSWIIRVLTGVTSRSNLRARLCRRPTENPLVQGDKKVSPLQGGGRSCACISKLQMRGGGSSRREKLIPQHLIGLEVRCKSLYDELVESLTSLEVRCKNLHFDLGIANTNMEVRYKSA